jgi:hypothetical protein
MGKWVPIDIEWFLAEPVQEFTFSNGDHPLVWVNTILVEAHSLDEGYEKAIELGSQYNDTYQNSDGVEVTTRFRGLRNLFLIHDKLEHGAEVLYEEFDSISEEEIAGMLKTKEKLAVFREAEVDRPN